MNDLLECEKIDKEKWERTYIASFTHTFLESIAMWCEYSRQLSETIRLQFLPSRIWKLIGNGEKHLSIKLLLIVVITLYDMTQ